VTEPSQPQRKITRKPAIMAPPGSCDCHSHVFGPASLYPYGPRRTYTPADASPGEYLTMLQTLGFERMVTVQSSVYGLDNSCARDGLATLGLSRARGIALVDVNATFAHLRALDNAGFRGVRIITMPTAGAPLSELESVARKIAPFGWHIELHVGSATIRELVPRLVELPVEILVDHSAQLAAGTAPEHPDFQAALRLLGTGKCWVKLTYYRGSRAGHPYADMRPIVERLAAAAPERCLWGSDWPHPHVEGHMPDDGDLFEQFCDWVPDAALRERILVDNPTALYFRR
jgi:predicted TIM-barrel fold metal-dependent hydrolase